MSNNSTALPECCFVFSVKKLSTTTTRLKYTVLGAVAVDWSLQRASHPVLSAPFAASSIMSICFFCVGSYILFVPQSLASIDWSIVVNNVFRFHSTVSYETTPTASLSLSTGLDWSGRAGALRLGKNMCLLAPNSVYSAWCNEAISFQSARQWMKYYGDTSTSRRALLFK